MEERGLGAAMGHFRHLSLSGLPWYGYYPIRLGLSAIPDVTLFGMEHRLGSARAKGLKKRNSAAILLKILGTPHCPKSQGKPVAGRRYRRYTRLSLYPLVAQAKHRK